MYVTPEHSLIAQGQEKDSSRDNHHVKRIGAHWESDKDFFASMKRVDEEDWIGKTSEKSRDKNEQNEENSGQNIPCHAPSSIPKV